MSLYETLDLNKAESPDAATIKRAYKRKAKETHPDKPTGSNEAFAKVSRAYLVLSDPIRRQKYDETGDIPEITPETAPLNLLVQFFVTLVQMHCNGRGPDPCTVDLIDQARKNFSNDIEQAVKHQAKLKASIKVWENVEKRFGGKKEKPAVIKAALAAQIPALKQQIAVMESQIVMRKDAMKLLDGYTFSFDPAPPTNYFWSIT